MTASNIKYHFENTRVIVTGATSGIGEATAIRFAEAGADVVLTGRSVEKGNRIIESLASLESNVSFIPGDITDSGFCNDMVSQSVEKMGGLDVVVNCAGVIYLAPADETTDEQWLETMNVNVNGMFYVCRAAIPYLKQDGGGAIINIASDAGLTASHRLTAYCASKGAVIQMSRAMAKDYAPDIRVIPLCPGDVDTPMLRGEFNDKGIDVETGLALSAASVPMQQVCSTGEVADLVLYAASHNAGFMTGYPLVLDGGSRA